MTNKEAKSMLYKKRNIALNRLNMKFLNRKKSEQEEIQKDIELINYILRKI